MEPYIPDSLPLANLEWSELVEYISVANQAIARYDGLLQSIPNPMILLAPLQTKEAVMSSRIEGTQATLEEVFAYEAGEAESGDKQHDIMEVINYRIAMNFAIREMQDRPINLNMLRRMHEILLQGVRGENKSGCDFRRIQNWIGQPGSTRENARFVPPSPANLMHYLGEWEKYIHHDDKDRLVQLGIVHAQFEIIHPFLDGNGRMGRILIPLFLYHHGIIHRPAFYLSAYFEKYRNEYYDHLKSITDTRNWTAWLKFFLKAVIEQSKENTEKVKLILGLYNEMKEKISEKTHSQFAIQTLDQLFITPVFNSPGFLKETKIPKPSANRILVTLARNEIIEITRKGKGRRPTVYRFRRLLDIVNH
ncbi:MAG TPA: Fic/DOC family N-terminal domain-containing protein [Bacteroidia bacterium]|nr:Fic/DOC family N-terminal domain-containing protein [Bacteroidia bacterium]